MATPTKSRFVPLRIRTTVSPVAINTQPIVITKVADINKETKKYHLKFFISSISLLISNNKILFTLY